MPADLRDECRHRSPTRILLARAVTLSVALCQAAVGATGAPQILASTLLAAQPAKHANGSAGPINTYGFDVADFTPTDRGATVECLYPGGMRYRCSFAFESPPAPGPLRRVLVSVPDLGLGDAVTVRFFNAHGRRDYAVTIMNPPQLLHEIETLLLPNGGTTTTGPDGRPAPVTSLVSLQATTPPALIASMPYAPQNCDQLYARWAAATATDPVMTSQFGPLNGSVTLLTPLVRGSPVDANNLPHWLVTFPQSATRVQFIAHYEVVFRVGVCSAKIIRQ